jgi:predicted acylesterase/phospholipase RssA
MSENNPPENSTPSLSGLRIRDLDAREFHLEGESRITVTEDRDGCGSTNNTRFAHPISGNMPFAPINTPTWPRKYPFRPNILVMKGGGVKGVAYVGALEVLEKYGYQFNHFVGTSAGAISAALLAVNYSSGDLRDILSKTSFKKFKDGWLPLSLLLLPIRKGLYRGESFLVWLENLLRAKFPQYANSITIRLSHLINYRLTVFASVKGKTAYAFDSLDSVTREKGIAHACRCSMAIPYFFYPERIEGNWVVDGGMQNNYPIDALLKRFPDLKDSADFIGLYLGNKEAEKNTRWVLIDLLSIWSESSDEEAKETFIDRTIVIDPRPVKTTDFSLSQNDVEFLLAEGRASALRWLYHWSDGNRPTLKEVEEAEKVSVELRKSAIAERWKKLLPRLIIAPLLLLLIAAVSYFAFSNLRTPPEKPTRSVPLTTSQFDAKFRMFNENLWHMPQPGFTVREGRLYIEDAPEICFPNQINYRNFEMFFHLKLTNSGGANWALRVRDPKNYYLFCLSGPEGISPGWLCVYIVRDNKFNPKDCISPVEIPSKAKLVEGGQYDISITAKENVFIIKITPSATGEETELLAYKDSLDTFPEGSIGFRTVGAEKFSIGTFRVIPPEVTPPELEKPE